ncbi:CPBP family intramembrane metalloprotease [Marinilabiliaceae bacterium ANBcel2]|nr:CPBP family intramembrane metalloprotease [Marinilabiliaceae bacterium ANBcel2]
MYKNSLSTINQHTKLAILLLLIIISPILISGIALFFVAVIKDLDTVLSLTSGEISIDTLRYAQIIQSFSIFIVPSIIAAWLFSKKPLRWLKFNKTNFSIILLSIILIFTVQPLAGWLASINKELTLPGFMGSAEEWMVKSEKSANNIIKGFLDTSSYKIIALNIFMIAILPAIGEEMLFRGAVQPLINSIVNQHHLAVWITAILFSAIHMQFFTFAPRLFLGAILGYLLIYGKSLWYPIIAHFIHNFTALSMFYYMRQKNPDVDPLTEGVSNTTILTVIATTLISILILYIIKIKRESVSQN